MPSRPPQHRPAFAQTRVEQQGEYDRWRGTPASRGYDATWRRLRAMHVAAHPLCARCLAEGKLVAVEDVHHVVEVRDAPHLRLDASNLESLCRACHSREHADRRK